MTSPAAGKGPAMRIRTFVVLAGVVMVALVGCGGSSDADDSPAPPSTTTAVDTSVDAGSSSTTTTAATGASDLEIMSSAFGDGGSIPAQFACAADGGNGDSPPLAWINVPRGTVAMVLVIFDPDAGTEGFTHLVANLGTASSVATAANRDDGPMFTYKPMCPPSGEHHYVFTLYAFGSDVSLPANPDKAAIDALAPKALATAKLTGLFAHP